jgi:hypothetical protein
VATYSIKLLSFSTAVKPSAETPRRKAIGRSGLLLVRFSIMQEGGLDCGTSLRYCMSRQPSGATMEVPAPRRQIADSRLRPGSATVSPHQIMAPADQLHPESVIIRCGEIMARNNVEGAFAW